jgi:glycine cleavage system H protein
MYPRDLRYTKEHEWVRDDGEAFTIGITAYAAEQLGDVTYVELPDVGKKVEQGGEAGAVESVKAASDVYAPIAGTVCEVNTALGERPELVNQGPYDEGWFFKLNEADRSGLKSLMDAAAYETYVGELDH